MFKAKKATVVQTEQEIDAAQCEIEEDKNDAKEADEPIKYTRLGTEDCPVDPADEEIEFSMGFRIPAIENLENCVELKVSQSPGLKTEFRGSACAKT